MAFGSHYNTCHCIWIGCANFLLRDSEQRGRNFSLPVISVRISAEGKKRRKTKQNQKKKEMRVVFFTSLEHGLFLGSLGAVFLTPQLLCIISWLYDIISLCFSFLFLVNSYSSIHENLIMLWKKIAKFRVSSKPSWKRL